LDMDKNNQIYIKIQTGDVLNKLGKTF
jgi:hypothetical protein